jgi:hypothetical protein
MHAATPVRSWRHRHRLKRISATRSHSIQRDKWPGERFLCYQPSRASRITSRDLPLPGRSAVGFVIDGHVVRLRGAVEVFGRIHGGARN